MTARGLIRGRPAAWDGAAWRWADTNGLAPGWGGTERPCPACGLTADENGPDPCLGWIEGLISACCGHEVEDAYQAWCADGQDADG
jgi:hypothetical protein